ncbi:MAG TPA: DUF488 domain-containing protein [Steroidobacteraceae bacterium]|jgi:uncharacterized protein (DUF488 family)
MDIFTIGHSTHPIERFVALLEGQGVQVLADVRSMPFSRFNPQFNRESLAKSLAASGIRYEFMGEALGARSTDPACYENGRVSYARLAESAPFKRGVEQLIEAAGRQRVAIMCAEKEPLDCHRTILVGRALERVHVKVQHILADGSVEEHRQAMERLVARLKLPADDLFSEKTARLEAAYEKQGARMAYSPRKASASKKS